MPDSPSRLFTIPPSAPFLPTLAAALVDGRLIAGFSPRNDPLQLADATVYLPTRRAARAFGSAILEALGTEATLLPRILPLGDVDEDELAFTEAIDSEELPPAITPTNRRLVLAQLILQWARTLASSREQLIVATPAVALSLADELARVFDDLTLAGVPFDRLDEVIPDGLDDYWKISRDFLRIAKAAWPAFLAEKQLMDPTMRRDALIARECARIAAGTGGPVIAAGSTGSLPAVAKLLVAIAQRKDGAIVLPGLDQYLDDASFDTVGGNPAKSADAAQGHPQFGLHHLLARLGAKRKDVEALQAPLLPAREKLLSEAFRPAATTERWHARTALKTDALQGFSIVEAADPREEALAIAVDLREALEAGKQTALITPDRALARRVAAELTRWGIVADDSAGTPLAESEAGRFARLVAVTAEAFAPLPLIALLRHPRSIFARDAIAIDALERGALRGPRPAPGQQGLQHAIASGASGKFHPNDPKASLTPEDWANAAALCGRISEALGPLCALGKGFHPLHAFLAAHFKTLQSCGLNLDPAGPPDTQKLAEVFDVLMNAPAAFELSLGDYADAFTALMAGTPLRPPLDAQARLRILGPLEARLVTLDRVVLGGLNEGTWPAEARTDAFLNRPMRRELGLNLPERRIGLSAHDLVQAMGTAEVVVTRARRQAGAETVASRSWQRIAAVADSKEWDHAIKRGNLLIHYARLLDRLPQQPEPIEPPTPRPPVTARPKKLSVTEIGDLVRDPYTIYAKHVLRLFPIDEIDADPGAADRGMILHDALAQFTKAFPEKLPPDVFAKLIEYGRAAFAPYNDFPGATAVWWPRYERVAGWFAGEEKKRRETIKSIFAETRGVITFDIANVPFTLSAFADRIDLFADGSIAVLDYKTGEAPTLRQAIIGFAPQLPLEAAIARQGGFKGVAQNVRVADIAILKLSGGIPPGDCKSLDPAEASSSVRKLLEQHSIETCDQLADFAFKRLQALLAAYANEAMPYRSIPRPKWRLRYGKYDHLARIKEWSESIGGET